MLMRRAFVAAVVLASVGVGCSVALGFDHYSDNADCSHAVAPPPPAHDNVGKNLGELVVAFSYMTLEGKDPKGAPISLGFDLDGICTACPSGVSSCKPLSPGIPPPCDEPGTGRDDAVRPLLDQIKTFVPFNDVVFNGALNQGLFSQLLQIDGYNGTADDQAVTVAYRNGYVLAGDGGPTIQGEDSWLVEPTSNGIPAYNVTGYVTGGTLVAKFVAAVPGKDGLQMVWKLPNGQGGTTRVLIALAEATITAHVSLSANGQLTLTDGRLGAKLTSSNALELPRAFGICAGPQFDQTRQLFCSKADLPNKDGFCDTLSFSLAFEAKPAKLGGELDMPVVSVCADGGPVPPAPSCLQQ